MKAAFCGSFDPVTLGHMDLIERAAALFEEVVVFVTPNSGKNELFSSEQKAAWIQQACAHLPNVEARIQEGLAVEACRKAGAQVLIRGLRNETDLGYEQNMAFMNSALDNQVETFCLFCRPEFAFISSSNVRELLKYHQSIEAFVPECVFAALQPALYAEAREQSIRSRQAAGGALPEKLL